MKKLVVIALFILAFASVSYGQDITFRMSGYLDAISELNRNVPQPTVNSNLDDISFGPHPAFSPTLPATLRFTPLNATIPPAAGGLGSIARSVSGAAYNKYQGYMESRFRLKFEAMLGKDVTGVIWFEGDAERWGGNTSSSGQQRNVLGHWGADRAGVEVKNFYIQFGLPYFGIPVPINIIAGVQPYAVRPGIYQYSDGAGVLASAKIDPVQINLSWFKPEENESWAADDVDIYTGEVFANIEKFKIGTYFAYWNMNTLPLRALYPSIITNPLYNANFYFWGLYGDGKLGPVNLQLDFLYNWGKVKNQQTTAPNINFPDVKYNGWVARGMVEYPWEMFNFGATALYGTGADAEKTSYSGMPGTLVASLPQRIAGVQSTKNTVALTMAQSENGYGDSIVFFGSGINRMNTGYTHAPYAAVGRGAYGGTWFAKLFAGWKVAPWYKIQAEGLYIGDTTKHASTIGTALNTDGTFENGSSIGFEFDLINEIQIYKNLKWTVGFGWLWAGNAMKYAVFDANQFIGSGATLAPNPNYGAWIGNEKPDSPWALITALTYVF